jgi:hypothetical protein
VASHGERRRGISTTARTGVYSRILTQKVEKEGRAPDAASSPRRQFFKKPQPMWIKSGLSVGVMAFFGVNQKKIDCDQWIK